MSYAMVFKAGDCRMHADECGKAARVLGQGARRSLLLAMIRTWHMPLTSRRGSRCLGESAKRGIADIASGLRPDRFNEYTPY